MYNIKGSSCAFSLRGPEIHSEWLVIGDITKERQPIGPKQTGSAPLVSSNSMNEMKMTHNDQWSFFFKIQWTK